MSTLQPTADAIHLATGALPAATAADAPQSSTTGSRDPTKTKLVGIALAAITLVAGTAGGFWWYWRGQGASTSASTAARPVAQLDPPAPFDPQLASPDSAAALAPAAQGDFEKTISRAPSMAKVLQSGLYSAAQQASGGDMLFRPLGRQPSTQEIPRHERWEIRFDVGSTLETYARQLDSFGIELGLIGGSDQIVYLYNLSKAKPDRRTAPATKDQRLYMTWQRGALRDADRQLFARAKIPTSGKIVAQFYPAEVERQLAEAEAAYAKQAQNVAIRKTIFGITIDNDAFRFTVVQQEAGPRRSSPSVEP